MGPLVLRGGSYSPKGKSYAGWHWIFVVQGFTSPKEKCWDQISSWMTDIVSPKRKAY